MLRYTLTLTAALMLGSGSVLGADKPDFEQADRNGDRRVSIEEATEAGIPKEEALFNDIDDDGKLTKVDWKFVDLETPDDSADDTN